MVSFNFHFFYMIKHSFEIVIEIIEMIVCLRCNYHFSIEHSPIDVSIYD